MNKPVFLLQSQESKSTVWYVRKQRTNATMTNIISSLEKQQLLKEKQGHFIMLISLLHIHATKQANKLTKQTPQTEEWKQKDEHSALEATKYQLDAITNYIKQVIRAQQIPTN
jgi:hypothetical protein